MKKQTYITPCTESMRLMQETVICGSFDGTDNTELFPFDNEISFDIIAF